MLFLHAKGNKARRTSAVSAEVVTTSLFLKAYNTQSNILLQLYIKEVVTFNHKQG